MPKDWSVWSTVHELWWGGVQYPARCRRGFILREDGGNRQSSFQSRIRGKLSVYSMEVNLEHSTRAAGGSACPGKNELLRGFEVSKAWQCPGERPGRLAATLFCSEFQKEREVWFRAGIFSVVLLLKALKNAFLFHLADLLFFLFFLSPVVVARLCSHF